MELQSKGSVLLVEDHQDIAELVYDYMEDVGYELDYAPDGEVGINLVAQNDYDAIILDLMLPGMDGYEVLARLRSDERLGSIPVILLTALIEEEERVKGFEVGADDYIAKPFSARELGLRVEALLRRSKADPVSANRRLTVGPIALDREAHRAFVDDEEIELTPLEYRLLEVLIERRGRVQDRRQLLQAVWDTSAAIETRTVDMHVGRLRMKLGAAASLIETVRGVGYRFRALDK